MENIKEKGFFRKFLDWLKTPDEEEVVDGVININAFEKEDKELLNELKAQAKRIDQKGTNMFKDEKAKKRAETVNSIKAEIKTPVIENSESRNIEEKEIEQ